MSDYENKTVPKTERGYSQARIIIIYCYKYNISDIIYYSSCVRQPHVDVVCRRGGGDSADRVAPECERCEGVSARAVESDSREFRSV